MQQVVVIFYICNVTVWKMCDIKFWWLREGWILTKILKLMLERVAWGDWRLIIFIPLSSLQAMFRDKTFWWPTSFLNFQIHRRYATNAVEIKVVKWPHLFFSDSSQTSLWLNVPACYRTSEAFYFVEYNPCLRLPTGWTVRGSNPGGARFSAPVQTGPEAHPASCTMGTGSFTGVRCCRGVTLTPHPLLVQRSKIE